MKQTHRSHTTHLFLLTVLTAMLISLTGMAATTTPVSEGEKTAKADQRRLTYYYIAAQQQKDKTSLSSMVDLLQHCLRIDSVNPAATYDLATIWFPIRRDSTAVEQLKRAVDYDPGNPWYLETLATAYMQLRQPDKSIPVLEKMAKLQSKRTDIPAQLFQLYRQQGRNLDAIQALDRLQTLQGNSTRIAFQKYQLYMDMNDTIKAFNVLHELCREFPYDASSLLLLSAQYLTLEQPDSAEHILRQVERIDPKNTMLQLSRMQYNLTVGDTARYRAMRDSIILTPQADEDLQHEAFRHLLSEAMLDSTSIPYCDSIFAAVLAPERPSTTALNIYAIYRSYIHNEKPYQLIPIFERIVDLDPSDLQVLQTLLQLYIERNDVAAIRDLCQKALIYHPSNLAFHYFLGMALAQEKQSMAAIKALTTAIRQVNEESNTQMIGDIYCLLGDLLHEAGEEKQAFAAYDSCLVYMPDNAMCMNNYAYFLSLKDEQLEAAEEMSYRAIKAEPTNKTYLDTYAWVLFMRKDYTTAQSYMNRVVNPELEDSALLADEEISAVLLEHAGDIQAKLDNNEQALRFWQLAAQKEKPSALLRKKLKKKKYVK